MDIVLSHLYMERLVKTTEVKIRRALEDAKKQSAIWCTHISRPTASNDGLIHPVDAEQYLSECREPVEAGLIEMVQRFCPVQWLWYLRRFPNIYHIEDKVFEDYCSTLAETLSVRSKRRDDSGQFNARLGFPLTQSIADYVLAFVAGVHDLGDLYIKCGAAARDIPFRIRARRLPEPAPTDSKRKAGEIFDARQVIGISELTGTIPSRNELPKNSNLYTVNRERYPVMVQLAYFKSRGLETPLAIPTYYLPRQVPLKHISNLYKLTNNGNGQWLGREVFSLMLLAGLLPPIAASAAEHSINMAMYGYSVHERSVFVAAYLSFFDDLVLLIKDLFPSADLPPSPVHMLNDLENLQTGTHPLLPGVIRSNERWIVIDHANAKERLGQMIRFPNLNGEIGAKRGIYFEDAIQSYIDASRWKPSDSLRAMRQIHLERREKGGNNQITDIDAIGESGDTLLIVSCKAVVFSVGQDIGEYHALKNARQRLDQAVLKWQAVKTELLDSPIGRNYDVSRYGKIIAIVCTPNAVYTESDLSLSFEAGKLRKSATSSELIDWLNT